MTGVPIDSDYNNTGYFTSSSAQDAYFSGKVVRTLSNYYYQREGIGIIKVQLTYAQCYTINYMRFKNTSYENKWFYAFVTKAEYISDTVTALHYTIDVMQTWMMNYTLEQCFIERQHSTSDNIGDNLAPESVDCGEMVYNGYQRLPIDGTHDMSNLYAMVAICDTNDTAVHGIETDNIYSGARLYAFDVQSSSELQALNNFLATYIQRPDAVVGMYMCPKIVVTRGGGSGDYANYAVLAGGNPPTYHLTLPKLTSGVTLNGYAPRNKKLLTYPYNYLSVDNASGQGLVLRYEYFGMGLSSHLQPQFTLDGVSLQPVELRLRPANYKGSGTSQATGSGLPINSEMLSIKNYPLCSWNFDTYKAWIAQNAVPMGYNMGASLMGVGAASGFNSGSFMGFTDFRQYGATMHVMGQVNNFLTQRYQASIASDMFKGTLQSGNVNVANDTTQFYYGRVSCNAEYAKRIDDYFTMFGYAQGIVARPNRRARQRFTYVKTIGCEISGQIPNDDQVLIKSIYDAGIRFWVDPDDIGNYATANGTL